MPDFPKLEKEEAEQLARALKAEQAACNALLDGQEPNLAAYEHSKSLARVAWERYFTARKHLPVVFGLYDRSAVLFVESGTLPANYFIRPAETRADVEATATM